MRVLGWLLAALDWPFCRFGTCLFVRFPRLGDVFWRCYDARR